MYSICPAFSDCLLQAQWNALHFRAVVSPPEAAHVDVDACAGAWPLPTDSDSRSQCPTEEQEADFALKHNLLESRMNKKKS